MANHAPLHRTDARLESTVRQRHRLRDRHSQAVSRLLEEREDLRGVHPLADFVTDALRWSV